LTPAEIHAAVAIPDYSIKVEEASAALRQRLTLVHEEVARVIDDRIVEYGPDYHELSVDSLLHRLDGALEEILNAESTDANPTMQAFGDIVMEMRGQTPERQCNHIHPTDDGSTIELGPRYGAPGIGFSAYCIVCKEHFSVVGRDVSPASEGAHLTEPEDWR
jgi:hypothetical protein